MRFVSRGFLSNQRGVQGTEYRAQRLQPLILMHFFSSFFIPPLVPSGADSSPFRFKVRMNVSGLSTPSFRVPAFPS